ncbi:BIG1-domain-containing protein [Xylona heveae TC161]|uniref:Protein BIG1 n=1 Tax=Xylona heveae (strain CBS 132557 / TC161) TaxID=1328760 RepID=A0A165K0H5_XYLHT|nr:BIG1-domain-containing protein [Xylona heveae TC161]KZF26851.1 BIG1-domain-containing protein [Xylona heveae TC161]
MRLRNAWALALGVAPAFAFQDSSPFFFASTSDLPIFPDSLRQLQPASDTLNFVQATLSRCPSQTYVIASQPGAYAADFAGRQSAPHLRRRISKKDADIASSFSVTDVSGQVNPDALEGFLKMQCGAGSTTVDASVGTFTTADDDRPRVVRVNFPALPTTRERKDKLGEHDSFLASIIDLLPSHDYTLVYITTPPSGDVQPELADIQEYEMEDSFPSPFATELKRDLSLHPHSSNETIDGAPLFEKYQFLTPGLFQGFLVGFLLLGILFVGINAIASLQVSYAAFDKENGPAAQKNKQQ